MLPSLLNPEALKIVGAVVLVVGVVLYRAVKSTGNKW